MKSLLKLNLLLVFLWVGQAQAQQETPTSFTLEACIKYALEQSVLIKNAEVDQQIAVARVKETRGIGLPQISGNVAISHNEKLRRFFSTYQTAKGFNPALNLPGVSNSDLVASQNFFQLKSTGDAGLNVSQILFNGSYIVGLQAANAYKDLAVKSSTQTKEQVIEQVSKAYYGALINRERLKLFADNISRVDSLLKNTKALNLNGFAESIDVDRVQVTLNNLTTERDNFANLQELSLELLKFQMNYPMEQAIAIEGDITKETVDINIDDYLKGWDYKSRSDFQLLEANRKLQALSVKNNYAASLPVLTASANLGYSTQSNNISGIFKTNSSFSDNGFIGPDKWYNYSTYGVNLSIPIFSGLQRNYKIQQEKLNLLKIENNFKTLKSNVDVQTKQATINYQNGMRSLESQKRNMELAAKVAQVTKIKYTQGVGSSLEVVDAESSLKTAQVNYYSALYDVLITKVDLDRTFGRLLQKTESK